MILAESFDYVPSSSLVGMWILGLRDLDTTVLERAFEMILKTWKPEFGRKFPTVADIRAPIDQADAKAFELEAEAKWQKLRAWIDRYYHPDIPTPKGAPSIRGQVRHAARAAGGFHAIFNATDEQLVWCRKEFIRAYTNVHQTGQVEHLLSDREAKRILSSLESGAVVFPAKQLPAPVESVKSGPGKFEMPEKLRAALRPTAPEEISEDEWRRREAKARRDDDVVRVIEGCTREEWERKKVEAVERVLGKAAGAQSPAENRPAETVSA